MKLELPEEIQEKLERAAHLRWVDHRADPHKIKEIADEWAALTAELAKLFGPVIEQLVAAEFLFIHVAENASFADATAQINNVHIDDEFGIILDCVPVYET
jgi:hypothetical protein